MNEDTSGNIDPDTAEESSSPVNPADVTRIASRPSAHVVPDRIGHYRIIRAIGEGGMGTVYEAEQESPRRTVALKVIRAGVASPSHLRRFEYEAQILGRLDHPGIATIFEAGTFDAGDGPQPFFAMELVKGEPLTDYADRNKLGTRERLELLARIADAVQHAHQKGVIHRDLKPGNILVTDGSPSSGGGQVKILDFGVARATDGDIQTTTLQTDIGQLIGTIPYMSPEQAAGDPDELDTRSDVYALGVVAYELLAGRLPYDLGKKMIHEAVRVIREDDPTPLSSINRVFRGDIEIIIGKALQKEKDRRYQSASDFASDIHRYLNDEPIVARPPSTWYQLSKFSKRNKALVGGVLAVLLVSVIGSVVSVTFAVGESEQKQLAFNNAIDAREAQSLAEQRESEASESRNRLQIVVDFQSSMLGETDAEAMGIAIVDGFEDRIRTALAERIEGQDELDRVMHEWRQHTLKAGPTSVALAVLDEFVLAKAAEAIEKDFADQPLVRASLQQTVANTYQAIGLYSSAMPLQSAALALRRQELGDDAPSTLTSINYMGLLLDALGRPTDAAEYLHEGLAGRRRVLGDEHQDTLTSLGNVGGLLHAEGKFAEAEIYYRKVLETNRRVLGDEHASTLISINSMASLLADQSKFTEAEAIYSEAIKTSRLAIGDEHGNTLALINNMGLLLKDQGRFAEAEPFLREALETRRRILGDEHADTLLSINNMGLLLKSQDKLSEAEPYYREALETRRRVFGNEHPSTLLSVNNMGELLSAQDKFNEAEPYFREAMKGHRRALGDNHQYTLVTINNMGAFLQAQGKLVDAEPYFREALEGHRHLLGSDHPNTLIMINNMGSLLRVLGKLEEAESLGNEAVSTSLDTFGPEHWMVAVFMTQLAHTHLDMKRFADAEPLIIKAQAAFVKVHGPTHRRTISATNQLIDLYTAWHAAEPDKGYDAKAEEWREKLEEISGTTNDE